MMFRLLLLRHWCARIERAGLEVRSHGGRHEHADLERSEVLLDAVMKDYTNFLSHEEQEGGAAAACEMA
jgi:hypothetical protein